MRGGDQRRGRRGHPRGAHVHALLHDRRTGTRSTTWSGRPATRSSPTTRKAATPSSSATSSSPRRGRRTPPTSWRRSTSVEPSAPPSASPAFASSRAAWSTRSAGGAPRTATSPPPEDAQVFAEELTHLIVTQKAAFNSPVWFNVGVPDTPQQCSACFILAVDDHMSSILNWYVEEGTIFKGGSGSGINLSQDPLVQGVARRRRHGVAVRSASCAAPTPAPARSSRAARPGAPPRWSSSTSTTPTWRTSSGARPTRSRRRARCATRGSTWTSTARTAPRSSTRTPTTRSASPTSSCARSSRTRTGS